MWQRVVQRAGARAFPMDGLPLSGEASVTCAHTGDTYTLSGSVVTRTEAQA